MTYNNLIEPFPVKVKNKEYTHFIEIWNTGYSTRRGAMYDIIHLEQCLKNTIGINNPNVYTVAIWKIKLK